MLLSKGNYQARHCMNDQHPIIEKLSAARRNEANWLRVLAICLFLFVTLTSVLVLCFLDYFFRFESHLTRAILLYAGIFVAVFAAIKLLWPILFYKRHHVEIARQLEVLEPRFGTQLSLATGFLIDRKLNGSSRLRDQVVSAVELKLRDNELPPLLKTRSPKIAIGLLSAVVVLATGVCVANPRDSAFAAQRLFQPLAIKNWPSFNQLKLNDLPKKIPAGESLDLVVIDQNSRLPDRVFIQIDDGNSIRKREMRSAEQAKQYRIENTFTSFKVRAIGGDGKTDWQSVTVIQPPEASEISIAVTPPTYSGLPDRQTVMFQKVWTGSEIVIGGTSEKEFEDATFVFANRNTEVSCKRSGANFVFPVAGKLRMTESLNFRIELADKDGISGGNKQVFRIPVRKDEPPFANLKLSSPQELYSLDDQVEFDVVASDDMKIKSIEYFVSVNGNVVFQKAIPIEPHIARTADRNDRIELTMEEVIALKTLPQIAEKSEIAIHSKVIDANGSESKSPSITLRIGTKQQLENLESRNKNQIFEYISDALKAQNESRSLVGLSVEEIKSDEALSTTNRLGRAVTQQQIVADILYGSSGVVELSNRLITQVGSPDSQRELTELVEKLVALKNRIDAVKNLLVDSSSLSSKVALLPQLKSIAGNQLEIAVALQALVGQIGEQQKWQGYLADIANLVNREKTAAKELQTIQGLMLGSVSDKDDNASTLSDIKIQIERIRNEQVSINEGLAEIAWSSKTDAVSLQSEVLRKLAESVKSAELLGKSASKKLQENQIGLALSDIQSIVATLDKLLNQTPKNAPKTGLTKAQIAESKSQLASIQSKQNGITQKLSDWPKLSDAEKQMVLDAIENQQETTQNFQQQFGPQLSESANQKLAQTSELLDGAKSDLQNNDVGSAKQKLDEASMNLKTVGEELDAKSDAAERDERNEKFRMFQQTFQDWLEAEIEISKKLTVLEQGSLNNQQQVRALTELTAAQTSLGTQFESLVPEDADFFVLQIQLKALSKNSLALVRFLEAKEIGAANSAAQELIKRLQQLVNSKIESEPPTEEEQKQNTNKRQDTTPKSGIAISEFEVQLLRLLQEEILLETEAVNQLKAKSNGGRDAAIIKKRAIELSEKQGQLISTINQYLGPETQTPNKTESIPEIPPISDIPEIGLPENDTPKIELPDIDLPDIDLPSIDLLDIDLPMTDMEQNDEPMDEMTTETDLSNCSFIQEESRIETLSPLTKQGEDIGEESDETKNRLQQVRDKMLEVQELLIQQKLSTENENLQNEIIEELKLFVTDQKKKSQKSNPKNKQPKDQKQGQNAASNSQTNEKSNKPETPDDQRNQQLRDNESAKRFEKIWGHLPDHLKQNELNIRSPKFIPKYRELIQNYFKRLAKENATK